MTSVFDYPHDVPVLDDDVVTLRPLGPADIDAVVAMCADAEMVRWTQVPTPYTREHAAEFLADVERGWVSGRAWCWGIEVGRGARVGEFDCDDAVTGYAGNVDLRLTGLGEAEIGFALHPAYRGRGLMRRAVLAVAAYAFDVVGVQSLLWTAGAGNWASRRVAWACGFTFRGRLPRGWSNGRDRADRWLATLTPNDSREPTVPWLVPPRLAGDRVVLRAQHDTDTPRMAEACRDERTRYWLAGLPDDYDDDAARQHIDECRERHSEGAWITWAIADPATDMLLGEISLMGRPVARSDEAEVGYWMHPEARGRGLMTEAVDLVVRWAFGPNSEVSLERISLRAADENTASRRVAEAAGFSLVGRQRRAESLRNGTVMDLVEYDVVPADLA